MRQIVTGQNALLSKRLPADVTSVGFLPSVNQTVPGQMVLSREHFSTDIAAVTCSASVDSTMDSRPFLAASCIMITFIIISAVPTDLALTSCHVISLAFRFRAAVGAVFGEFHKTSSRR